MQKTSEKLLNNMNNMIKKIKNFFSPINNKFIYNQTCSICGKYGICQRCSNGDRKGISEERKTLIKEKFRCEQCFENILSDMMILIGMPIR